MTSSQHASTAARPHVAFSQHVSFAVAIALALAVAGLDAHAAAPASQPAAGRPATLRLIVTLEVATDGSSRIVSSEPLTPELLGKLAELLAADRAEQAARVAAAAARAEAAKASKPAPAAPPTASEPRSNHEQPKPAATPAEKPPFPGQCTGTATSSGKRCRQKADAGSDRCQFHPHKAGQ